MFQVLHSTQLWRQRFFIFREEIGREGRERRKGEKGGREGRERMEGEKGRREAGTEDEMGEKGGRGKE